MITDEMWEFAKTTSHGGISMRRIFSFALATIVAAFLWALVIIPNTYAADATWNSTSSISYDGNTYNGPADTTTVKNLGLPDETEAYTYVDPAPTGTGTSAADTSQKVHVIYFASSADASTAISAKYETYTYQGANSFTNPSSPTDISTDQQSAASSKSTKSCAVEGGLGWIICPVTNLLANGMDMVFGIISGFLTVRPVGTGQETALFRAWTYMRSFANIAFVIAFLIIIYSQLTNFGISNYGIKKLLPRIIIAAILVNISYYICAVAVDISNILGYGIQDAFVSMRNGLIGSEGSGWDSISWKSIASFILSGGTAAAAGITGMVIAYSSFGVWGSVLLLLPTLMIGLLAVLTALLIMAARQAIITILIVIAPLAFVAYLLPNTEKWFEKWRSTMMTLLILFPAFSIVFGGSQLAAAVITRNADSINVIILGMLVEVAPLFITPLLINLSGSLLGKIASVVNSPNKAIVDRTRKFSEDRAGNAKAKRLAQKIKPIDTSTLSGKIRRYTPGVRLAQTLDHNRRKRESWKKINEGTTDNRFSGSSDYKPIHEAMHRVELDKRGIEQKVERDLLKKISTNSTMLEREMKVSLVTNEAKSAKAIIDQIEQELNAGKDTSTTGALSALTARSVTATRNIAISGLALENAKRAQQESLEKLIAPAPAPGTTTVPLTGYATAAAGIGGTRALERVQATAKSAVDRRFMEDIASRVVLKDASTTPAFKIRDSDNWLRAAITANDSVEARASLELLMSTGAAGKERAHKIFESIGPGDTRDVIVSLKNGLLKGGIKVNDIALDKWAINTQAASLKTVTNNPDTYLNLSLEEWASQNNQILRAAFNAKVLTPEIAEGVLSNDQASNKLSDGKKKFYEAIRDDSEIPPSSATTP